MAEKRRQGPDRTIVALYVDYGRSIRQITGKTGLSHGTVYNVLVSNDVRLRGPGDRTARSTASHALYRQILEALRETQLSYRQIGAKFGCSRTTVSRAVEWGRQS